MRRIVYDVEARVDVLEIVERYEKADGPEVADRFTSEIKNLSRIRCRTVGVICRSSFWYSTSESKSISAPRSLSDHRRRDNPNLSGKA